MKESAGKDGHRTRVAVDHTKSSNPIIESTSDLAKGSTLCITSSEPKSPLSSSSLTPTPCPQTGPSLSSQPLSNRSINASNSNVKNPSLSSTPSASNFDDDYNEWELGIGDLIIDLDADIERQTNDKTCGQLNGSAISAPNTQTIDTNSDSVNTLTNLIDTNISEPTCGSIATMSTNSKSSRVTALTGGPTVGTSSLSTSTATAAHHHHHHHHHSGGHHHHNHHISGSSVNSTSSTSSNSSSSSSTSIPSVVTTSVEHSATVDKGLKMKIKRKNIGGKSYEAKHEIVSSDISAAKYSSSRDHSSGSSSANSSTGSTGDHNQGMSSATASSATPVMSSLSSSTSDSKSAKHSNKGRSGSHRDKKDKNRDKDKTSTGSSTSGANSSVGTVCSSTTTKINATLLTTKMSAKTSVASTEVNGSANTKATTDCQSNANESSTHSSANSSSGLNTNTAISRLTPSSTMTPLSSNTLTLKYSSPSLNPTVILRTDELTTNIGLSPNKKIKLETKPEESISATRDTGTSASIGTITEPDCLGPCEPGTSVTLEGIVWQETEGGVLVVNVTWRGKTYVGTLLDCTKHDWAPPRFCESPTSDIESKNNKNSRAKRSRTANMTNESTTENRSVQSKLRNGKGRRTANSGFTVPASPVKSDSSATSSSKRKGRPSDLELSPITETLNNNTNNIKGSKRNRSQTRNTSVSSTSSEPNTPVAQPSSPILIECPEPNCSKKYKHINGLKYHQTHAHCHDSNNTSTDVNSVKDALTITSDNEDNNLDSTSLPSSPNRIIGEDMIPEPNDNSSTLALMAIESNDAPKSDPKTMIVSDNSDKLSEVSTNLQIVPITTGPIIGGVCVTTAIGVTTTTTVNSSTSLANSANTFLVSSQPSYLIDKNIKVDNTLGDNKMKSSNTGLTHNVRPIAPMPGINNAMIAASANLKLIQPKPTILGEPTVINPSLEGLKKEKSKHKKKSKDRDRERDKDRDKDKKFSNDNSLSILSNTFASDTKFTTKPIESSKTGDEESGAKMRSSLDAPVANDLYTNVDLVNAPNSRPMNFDLAFKNMNANNVCESDTNDNKLSASEASIENVRSPAYSDISDANDTTPPIDTNDMESIDKSEDNLTVENPNLDISSQSSPNFRLYPYFNQSQYLMPVSASNAPDLSQTSQRSSSGHQDSNKNNETEFSRTTGAKRPRVNSDQSSDKSRSEDSLSNVKGVSDSSPLPSNSPPENMQDFASVSQSYPYPVSYMQRYPGFSIDPNYHMHLMSTDPHYKEQCERYLDHERLFKDQPDKDKHTNKSSDLSAKQSANKCQTNVKPLSQPSRSDPTFELNPISTNIKDKQSENRQILKENIELKSQMDAQNIKNRQTSQLNLPPATFGPMFDRHREDHSKRYFMDSLIEHQTKTDIDAHASAIVGPPPLLKDGINRSKSDPSKSSTSSTSHKHSISPSLSSPKPKDSLKKDKLIDEKDDKNKAKMKEEGVKPTMETTGPPPPPTNGYYFNPSYLAPHFSPFDPSSHPMFRAGSMSPVMMGNPYSGQYLPPQLRYHMSPVAPPSPIGSMDIPGAPQLNPSHPPSDPLVSKMHSSAPNAKNVDHLHPVPHFASHKIHELQERALISPTATNTSPHQMQSSSKTLSSGGIPVPTTKPMGSAMADCSPMSSPGKDDSSDKSLDRQRSPPPQRHLHTHHHTHVGVGYPIYDPYSAMIVSHSASTAVPMHPFVPK